MDMLDRLTSQSYIAKSQGYSLKKLQSELPQNECIVLLDFAENYKYVVQNLIRDCARARARSRTEELAINSQFFA